MADAIRYVVIHMGSLVRIAVVKIGVEQMAGATSDIEFARTGLQRDIDRLRALQVHRAGVVLQIPGIAAIVGKRATVPKQDDQDQHEGQSAEGRSQRNASGARRAIRILPRARDIPHFSQAYKYQNQWPIRSQDRPRIKCRPPVRVQKHSADGDKHHRQHKRSSSLSLTVSHRTPLLSLLRGGHKKSSAGPTGFLQREYR